MKVLTYCLLETTLRYGSLLSPGLLRLRTVQNPSLYSGLFLDRFPLPKNPYGKQQSMLNIKIFSCFFVFLLIWVQNDQVTFELVILAVVIEHTTSPRLTIKNMLMYLCLIRIIENSKLAWKILICFSKYRHAESIFPQGDCGHVL